MTWLAMTSTPLAQLAAQTDSPLPGGDPTPEPRPGLAATVAVEPWTDPMVETYGHDPRSAYAETFWLPVVGPSTAWMLRRFATGFDHSPDGYTIDCAQFSAELGLGRSLSRNAAFVRSVDRACKFGLAQRYQDQLYVRRMLPPLAPRHLRRIPERLRIVHQAWQHGRPRDTDALDRAGGIATVLIRTGASQSEAEQQLLRWGFEPALAWSAVVGVGNDDRSVDGDGDSTRSGSTKDRGLQDGGTEQGTTEHRTTEHGSTEDRRAVD